MTILSTWLNSSGCLTAFAYWLMSVLFLSLQPKRYKLLPTCGICGIFLVLTIVFCLFIDGRPAAYSVIAFGGNWLLQTFMFRLCCRTSLRNLLFFLFRAFIAGEFLSALELLLTGYFRSLFPEGFQIFCSLLLLLAVCAICFTVFYLMERRYRSYYADLTVSKRELLSVFFIVLGVYLFSNISNVSPNTPFSSSGHSEVLLIRMLADLGGVIMLYSYEMLLYERKEALRLQMLEQIMAQQAENYQISEQSIRLIHQKYHDLKHQIDFLRSEIRADEKTLYLDRMEQEIQGFESRINTGNKVLDTLLMTKSLLCREKNIQFTAMADGHALDFMDPMDLSALFGNMLDNAVEGAAQVQDSQNRWIHIRLEKKRDFVVFSTTNSCEGTVSFRNGLPVTRKEDKRYHGFGTASIKSIAEKYGGAVVFRCEKGCFEVKGTLPAALANK